MKRNIDQKVEMTLLMCDQVTLSDLAQAMADKGMEIEVVHGRGCSGFTWVVSKKEEPVETYERP